MEAAQKESPKGSYADYDYSHFYYGAGDDPLNILGPFRKWLETAFPNAYYLYSEPMATAPTTRVVVRSNKTGAQRELLNLASYNYLGISYRDEVKEAAIEAIRKYGLGASGSPILSGTFDVHLELEQAIARFKGKESAILFPTGYSANVGFISALMRSGDNIVLDQYSHASIVDGAILAKSKTTFFRHNNPLDLERKLSGMKGKKLVVIEGVYSMDGDICALPEIVDVCKRHGARILIDEAHSTFLFGPNGRGVAEHFGLDKEVDFHLGTFSKSLGGQGGFVCGSQTLIHYTAAFGRSRFFSCNLAPALAAGLVAGLKILENEPQLRAKLWSNVAYLRRRFAEEGVDIGKSTSQVMPVLINNDSKVFPVCAKIQERGVYLQPVTYPAVPKHKSRLRVSISAAHTEEDLEQAAQAIGAVLREEGLSR
jgi:8-amino-7-oxononanoate synthase